MTGVQTDAHPVLAVHQVQNRPQLPEGPADLAALPGHGLQQDHRFLLRPEYPVEHTGNHSNPGLRPLSHMAAGMEVVVIPGQVLHQRQVPGHHLRRQRPDALVPGAGIHNVGRVGDDGPKFVLLQQSPALRQVRRVRGLGLGPPGVADKALEGIGPDPDRRLGHLLKSPGGGHMSPNIIGHSSTSLA